MPFFMVRNDIVNMDVDAIVNPSNIGLRQGRGTSRGIFLAAGEEALTQACSEIGSCELGKAVITPGYALKADYIIHAVCPRWRDGSHGEDILLRSAYTESMKLALSNGLESIAFPLLSSGNYGYPKEAAMKIAVESIRDFLKDHELTVYLVLYDRRAVKVREEIAQALEEYLSDHYVELIDDRYTEDKDESYPHVMSNQMPSGKRPSYQRDSDIRPDAVREEMAGYASESREYADFLKEAEKAFDEYLEELGDLDDLEVAPRPEILPAPRKTRERLAAEKAKAERRQKLQRKDRRGYEKAAGAAPAAKAAASKPRTLDDLVKGRAETFSQMLLRLIDEKGMTDPEVYNKANIDRRHFAKIRKDPDYAPKKSTVLSLAIAMELSYDETRDLLMRAGYAFSESSAFDVIIRFFIENGIYDILDINEALFHYGQPVLGL